MNYKYWLACMVNLVGVKQIHCLLERFGSAEEIYRLEKKQLLRIPYLREETADKLIESKKETEIEASWEQLLKKDIRLVTIEEKEYPNRLRTLPDAPYGLFIRGELPKEESKSAAIVGARLCSEYGREIAGMLGETLAKAEVEIVSGMAKGIDSAGHYGALRGAGNTYAVLGCGTDICYPAGNERLYEKILKDGGILSEYPPGTPPLAKNFPMRNRIISGLCDILVVVEAREKSGSLITADAALEQGREIYAVPGRLGDKLSGGCNRLIKQGAGMILSPEDFLTDIGIYKNKKEIKKNFSKNLLEKEEMLLYSVLDLQPKNINEIINATGFETSECIRLLAGLEEGGYIRETFQNYYIRTLNM